ncbi:MAG: LysR substrate-binding domain-containing protein [Pseudomonas sp.]
MPQTSHRRAVISRYLRTLPPLETLITFEAVGRYGSFTQAATELFLTQSAVSKQMRALEDSLKVPLFERKPRGVTLTAAGVELLGTVDMLLDRLQHSVRRIRNVHQSNAVSVLATHAMAQFWLFPRLIEFNKAHPGIAVHVHAINEMDEASLVDFDLGILYGAGDWTTLDCRFVLPEVVYPVARPDFDASRITTLEQLAAAPLVQLDTSAWSCLDWHDWFGHFGKDYQPAESDPVFNQLTLAYRAVQQGMGIGLAWGFMADEAVANGEMQRVTDLAMVTERGEYLVSLRHRQLSPAAQLFHDWLLASLGLDETPA